MTSRGCHFSAAGHHCLSSCSHQLQIWVQILYQILKIQSPRCFNVWRARLLLSRQQCTAKVLCSKPFVKLTLWYVHNGKCMIVVDINTIDRRKIFEPSCKYVNVKCENCLINFGVYGIFKLPERESLLL